MCVGTPRTTVEAWTFHNLRRTSKTTPAECLEWNIKLSVDWTRLMRDTAALISCPRSLRKMRISFSGDAETFGPEQSRAAIVLDYLLQWLSEKVWADADRALRPPFYFAAAMSGNPTVSEAALARLQKHWRVIQDMEALVPYDDSWEKLYREIYWLCWPIVRITFMCLDQERFVPGALSKPLIEGLLLCYGCQNWCCNLWCVGP